MMEMIELFRENQNTLKELSKDTSKAETQYMTESELLAVDFDRVKRIYTNSLGLSEDTAKSCDGLAMVPAGPIFIEFKNGKVPKDDVKTKIRDSLLLYCDIVKQTISDTRQEMEFILVYNEKENQGQVKHSQREIKNHLAKKAGTEHILFGLERFQTLYFRAVHTYSPSQFETFLQNVKKKET